MIKINLKIIREAKEISQNKLSSLVGCRQGYISEIESEKKIPKIQFLDKVCEALKCDIAELLEYIPNSKENKKEP